MRRRFLALASVCSLLAVLAPAALPAQAQQAMPAVEGPADWVPYTGSYAVWCTRASPENPGCPVHHPTWAIDFSTTADSRIRAAGNGMVVGVHRGCAPLGGDGECNGGAGNMVVLRHGDYYSRYLHLARIPKRIQVGTMVEAGQLVGRTGASGTFGGAHLHYDEYQPGPPSGRVAFGGMYACHGDTPVVYPDILGYQSWDLVPPGTIIRNDGYDCTGHPALPHPPSPEPPVYPEGVPLGIGGSQAVAVADLDGDGDMDLAVGSPGGRAAGQRTGTVALVDPLARSATPSLAQGVSMQGLSERGDRVGSAVVTGDFDCDGRADLAIGAPGEDLDEVFVDTGAVNVVYGDGGEQLLFAGSGIDSYYRRPHDWLGAALAVGDFNGDDCDDLAIASPGADRSGGLDMGLVWVLRGGEAGLSGAIRVLQGINFGGILESHDQTGWSLAAGDFDCDGIDDLAAGAPREVIDDLDAGAVLVAYGTGSGGFRSGEAVFRGNGLPGEPGAAELLGLSLAAGDIDADGCDDLAVGAPGRAVDGKSNAGAVLVAFGGDGGMVATARNVELTWADGLRGEARRGDRAGTAVTLADLDCDGFADLVSGAPGRDVRKMRNAGMVHVVAGSDVGLASRSTVVGQHRGLKGRLQPLARVGSGLVTADIDLDGCDDIAISAPGAKAAQKPRAGAVHVLFGTGGDDTDHAPIRVDQRLTDEGAARRGTFGGASPLELFEHALIQG